MDKIYELRNQYRHIDEEIEKIKSAFGIPEGVAFEPNYTSMRILTSKDHKQGFTIGIPVGYEDKPENWFITRLEYRGIADCTY